jgi:hypothetical protein
VAGQTPSSRRAEANLAAALADLPSPPPENIIEIIDVLRDPHQAMRDRVIVTPSLILIGATPPVMLIGDLSDAKGLRTFLEAALA